MTLWELSLMNECYEKNCLDQPPEPGGGDDCLWNQCFAELYVCIGGDGDASCEETLDCQAACGDEDGGCIMDCMAKSSEAAIEVALKIAYAEDSANYFTYLFECVEGEGQGTCGEMAGCLTACGMFGDEGEEDEENKLDIACIKDCIKSSSDEAKELFLGLFSCGEEPCQDKMMECMGGAGEMTCGEALSCMGDCNSEGGGGDEDDGGDCSMQCSLQTSPEEHDKLLQYWECTTEACGGEMEGCPAQFICIPECTGGGDSSCGEVFNCNSECEAEGGTNCFGECVVNISIEGAEDLGEFLACYQELCPEDEEECPQAYLCGPLCP